MSNHISDCLQLEKESTFLRCSSLFFMSFFKVTMARPNSIHRLTQKTKKIPMDFPPFKLVECVIF